MSISEAACVDEARRWAEELCEDAKRGRSDFVGAMKDVAARLRIPSSFFNELFYRSPPPKKVSGGRLLTLWVAYEELKRRRALAEPEGRTSVGKALYRLADTLDCLADAVDPPEGGSLK